MVNHYEGMFLAHNKEARKDTDYLAEHVTALVEKAGGKVDELIKWDERKLAYPIKGVTHGVYFLTSLSGESAFDGDLRGEVRLSGLVLRHQLLKKESHPEKLETFSELQNRMMAAAEAGERSADGTPAAAPAAAAPATATATAAAPATETAAAPAAEAAAAPAAETAAAPAAETAPEPAAEPAADTPADAEPPKTEGDE